jgi:hypothetical protein
VSRAGVASPARKAPGAVTACLREPFFRPARSTDPNRNQEGAMNAIIYLVGLVVIVMFILSVVGLR